MMLVRRILHCFESSSADLSIPSNSVCSYYDYSSSSAYISSSASSSGASSSVASFAYYSYCSSSSLYASSGTASHARCSMSASVMSAASVSLYSSFPQSGDAASSPYSRYCASSYPSSCAS